MKETPWWAKMVIKSFIEVLPVSYEKVREILTGNKGGMEKADYALGVFNKFFDTYQVLTGPVATDSFLELGPGGSLLNGVLARSKGFEKAYLIDVGDFASKDEALYSTMLRNEAPNLHSIFETKLRESGSINGAMEAIGVFYLTKGLKSLSSIDPETVAFSFSNAVLEHVRKDSFEETIRLLHRCHVPSSITIHQIDYKDHLSNSLNNLRIPTSMWESKWIPNDGYYTNRLRHPDILNSFARSGFAIKLEKNKSWEHLPLPMSQMAREFANYEVKDLLIQDSFLALSVERETAE
jgi:hypothetical protein